MLDSGFSQMKKAFNCHKQVVGTSITHNMVLFYAAEVGLKSYATSSTFQSRPLTNSEASKKIPTIITHDLPGLIAELRLPAKAIGSCPALKLKSGNSITVARWHEAWRYGITLDSTDEQKAIEWLKSIVNFLGSKIF